MKQSPHIDYTGTMKKQPPQDKKRMLREQDHLTRPPQLEGKAKNAQMNPTRKQKKKLKKEE